MIKKNIYYLLLILIIFLVDRTSKILILNFFETAAVNNIEITSFLSFYLIWNEGIAFGLFSIADKFYYNIFSIIIIIITCIIFWMIFKTQGLEKLGFSMIFGGSIGNIFDRIYYNAVPDYLDFHINNFHWFIFNVADIFISLGVILLIFLELFIKNKK